jgi:hypothetical protein
VSRRHPERVFQAAARHHDALSGHVVEDELTLTLDELCGICAVRREQILELAEHGVLDRPADDAGRFDGRSLRRAPRSPSAIRAPPSTVRRR